MAAPGLKRRHEEAFDAVSNCIQSEKGARNNVAILSTNALDNYNTGDDRVHSPNAIMDAPSMFAPTRESKRTLSFTSKREARDSEGDPNAERRVTIWNWREQRKLSGNSAPFKKNLKDYIRKHPDWEEYVGQDKDEITGKKLSAKKLKAPAPHDPEHPWYTMQRSGASSPSVAASPAPNTSSYGTRSTQSRRHENDSGRHTRRAKPVQPEVSEPVQHINPELSLPMCIKLEPPSVVAHRRSLEMAARREAMATEVDAKSESTAPQAEAEQSKADAEAAAWKAASEKVAQLRAEKEAAERKLAAEVLAGRQKVHAEVQQNVVSAAMARIQAFKKRRSSA